MAEINLTAKNNGSKRKQKSARVDLTPMVDLGFILITFFIFTATLSQPTTMRLTLPKDTKNEPTLVKESGVLTLLPAGNNRVYYYEGKTYKAGTGLQVSNTAKIGEVVLRKKRSVAAKDLFIIIKPAETSAYKNLVDVLDEMTINDIRSYALVDITGDEEQMVDNQ